MRLILITCLMAFSALHAQTNDAWKKLEFLLGNWTGVAGEKDTQLGSGQGDFSFQTELKDKIIVRRNNARYDSGVQHDDLMVMYLDTPNALKGQFEIAAQGNDYKTYMSWGSKKR